MQLKTYAASFRVWVNWSCDTFQLLKPMRCCFIGLCKFHFFGKQKYSAQWLIMCCAICGFPQTQFGESFSPQWNVLKLKRPTQSGDNSVWPIPSWAGLRQIGWYLGLL